MQHTTTEIGAPSLWATWDNIEQIDTFIGRHMRYAKAWIASMLTVAALVTGCSASNEEIAEQVKSSMQNTLSSDSNFAEDHMTVEKVTVVKLDGNKYQGMATVMYEGEPHEVGIDVSYDGTNMMWQAPPGSFGFVAQKRLQKLGHLFN